jgi:hypothetical protein
LNNGSNWYVISPYRNIANSMGLISTSPLTITEHREKKNEEIAASMIPKYGQEHVCDFIHVEIESWYWFFLRGRSETRCLNSNASGIFSWNFYESKICIVVASNYN